MGQREFLWEQRRLWAWGLVFGAGAASGEPQSLLRGWTVSRCNSAGQPWEEGGEVQARNSISGGLARLFQVQRLLYAERRQGRPKPAGFALFSAEQSFLVLIKHTRRRAEALPKVEHGLHLEPNQMFQDARVSILDKLPGQTVPQCLLGRSVEDKTAHA